VYKYLFYFVLLSPLAGVILMENGALGVETYDVGHPNNASLAFLVYVIFVLLSFYIVLTKRGLRISFKRFTRDYDFNSTGFFIMVINIVLLFFMLFVVGGIDVLLHKVDKGVFRAQLGVLGLPSYLIRDNITPTLIAYLSFVYVKSEDKSRNIFFLVINYLLAALIASSFGFKTGAVFALLPGFLLLFWRISFKLMLKLSIFFLFAFVMTAIFIDRREFKLKDLVNISFTTPDYDNALNSVLYRATVVQGNTSWHIWEAYINGHKFFDYPPTLKAALGDRFLNNVLNINRKDFPNYVKYHYTESLTLETGIRTIEEIKAGHTTIGQVFSEGIIAGGFIGMIIFAIFAGFYTGINYKIIEGALFNGNAVAASLMINYYVTFIIGWLNGGGIAGLFHISAIFGLVINYTFLFCLITMQGLLIKHQLLPKQISDKN
jgi:hypothetical protein